jgi:hypothetical protein
MYKNFVDDLQKQRLIILNQNIPGPEKFEKAKGIIDILKAELHSSYRKAT